MMSILLGLNRAKAAGNELDSLDIFIKLAALHKRQTMKNQRSFVNINIVAAFFSTIIQGNIPAKIAKILRTTYMVALRKCEVDQTKLRPLGIPSAIRRVAAKVILHIFRPHFARHLLPIQLKVCGRTHLLVSAAALANAAAT